MFCYKRLRAFLCGSHRSLLVALLLLLRCVAPALGCYLLRLQIFRLPTVACLCASPRAALFTSSRPLWCCSSPAIQSFVASAWCCLMRLLTTCRCLLLAFALLAGRCWFFSPAASAGLWRHSLAAWCCRTCCAFRLMQPLAGRRQPDAAAY